MRFLIVEDHPLVRTSMIKLLQQYFSGAECLEHHSFEQAVKDLKGGCPDLILLDLSLPGIQGLEAMRLILLLYPDARILIMSGSTKHVDIQRSLDAGAKAYLSKTDSTAHIVEMITKVLQNKCVPTSIQRSPRLNKKVEAITDEHKDILQMIASGKTNKEIAQALEVSEAFVKTRCRHIYQKLGVNNRTQALRESISLGIL